MGGAGRQAGPENHPLNGEFVAPLSSPPCPARSPDRAPASARGGGWPGGEADEHSDIDLVVAFEPGRSLLDHAALLLDLQELLGGKVDVVSDRGIKPRFRDRVLNEAVPL